MRQFKKLLASAAILMGAHGFVLGAEPLYPDLISWAKEARYMYDADIIFSGGRKLLRFSSAVANKGAGPFELRGQVESDGTTTAYQRIYNDDGSFVDRFAGVFEFQGHEDHNHFHFAEFAGYYLKGVAAGGGAGATVASSDKVGFAMWDVTSYDLRIPGAPLSPVYNRPVGADVEAEGISVGWADIYEKTLEDQYIDITGIADGVYWLENRMDPNGKLVESDETNNSVLLRIQIDGDQVSFPPEAPPNPEPVLTELVPSSATVGTQGKTIELHGSGFMNGSIVRWNGSARSTVFVESSLLRASFSASDLDSETTADITVFNPAPGGGVSAAREFTIYEPPVPANPVPALTELVPSSVTAGTAGKTIEIRGSNFMDGSIARINGQARPTTFDDSSHLFVFFSADDLDSAGTASITVFNPSPGGGISAVKELLIYELAPAPNPAPSLDEISPTSATAGGGGRLIELRGSNFIPDSAALWNGSPRTTTFISGSFLRVFITAQDLASDSAAILAVRNPAPGGGDSDSETFIVYTPPPTPNPAPVLTEVYPSSIPAGTSGMLIEVLGTQFIPGSVVRYNGQARPTVFVNSTLLHATLSAGDLGSSSTATVSVFTPEPGGGISEGKPFIIYALPVPSRINPVPVLRELSPSSAFIDTSGEGLTIEVRGEQFMESSAVGWNGEPRFTTFANESILYVYLTAQDLNSEIMASITVFTPAPGGGISAAMPFVVQRLPGFPPPPPPPPPPPSPNPQIPAEAADLNDARVFPNPWRVDQHRGRNIILDRLTDQSTVFFFTISGQSLRTLRASAGSVEWDLMNDSGEPVGSGLYFYLITDNQGRRRSGTLALIR